MLNANEGMMLPTHTLSRRLLYTIFPWYLAVSLGVISTQLLIQFLSVSHDIDRDLRSLGRTMGPYVTEAVWELDSARLDSIVSGLRQNAIVTGIRIEAADGKVLASDGIVPVESRQADGFAFGRSKWEIEPLIYQPVGGLGRQIGNLKMYSSPSVLWDRSKYSLVVALSNFLIAAAALWLVLSWAIRYRLSNTVSRVAAAVRNWQSQPADTPGWKIDYPYRDELGELVNALNESRMMQASLLHNLNELNRNLEHLVTVRTQELQQAKAVAEAAHRAQGAFLATMSHEIRTPMNSVLGMLELMSLSQLDREQRATLQIVRESGRSLLRIIDDILDFSKIEAGKLEIHPEAASTRDVLESVRNLFMGFASGKGLLLTLSVDSQISAALAMDSVRLRQILNNLVSNAIKFTSKGQIEIKAELIERMATAERVRFSIADTGSGISAENQRRLFLPFTQVESAGMRHHGGTGLGLTICQRLAEMMGSVIEVVSEPGRGTTMALTLTLPIADPHDLPPTGEDAAKATLAAVAGTRRMAPDSTQGEKEKTLVLLVDDHPTNRLLMVRMVRALGYACEAVESGTEALSAWKSGRFALIITDCNMPDMDGYEMARSIRAQEVGQGGKRIPIVACTANVLRGTPERCFAAGMDDYLAKPVELQDLCAMLDRWLPIPLEASISTVPTEKPDTRNDSNADDNIIDRRALAQISQGDASVERELLADFRKINDQDASGLQKAVVGSDTQLVTRLSHRIKAASWMVGAMPLAGVCERIENAVRMGDWTAVNAEMAAFHYEWRRLNAHLDSLPGGCEGQIGACQ